VALAARAPATGRLLVEGPGALQISPLLGDASQSHQRISTSGVARQGGFEGQPGSVETALTLEYGPERRVGGCVGRSTEGDGRFRVTQSVLEAPGPQRGERAPLFQEPPALREGFQLRQCLFEAMAGHERHSAHHPGDHG
jgi:hypothetical protein